MEKLDREWLRMKSINNVSVIVSVGTKDDWFFKNYCLPSIEQNNPEQIIIIDGLEDSKYYKINSGLEDVKCPYTFICEPNVSLSGNLLGKMFLLAEEEKYDFVYTDYLAIKTSRCVARDSWNINEETEDSFDWKFYINKYPDLLERLDYNYESAWRHWIKHGRKEGRVSVPASDVSSLFVRNRYWSRDILERADYLDYEILFRSNDHRFDESLNICGHWDFWLSSTEQGETGWYLTEIYPQRMKVFLKRDNFIKHFSNSLEEIEEKKRIADTHRLGYVF